MRVRRPNSSVLLLKKLGGFAARQRAVGNISQITVREGSEHLKLFYESV